MGIASAIGGIASLGGSLIGAGASKSAASQQAAAAQQSAAIQQAEFQQTQQNLSPFREAGQSATNNLLNISGANGQPASAAALAPYGLSGLTFQPTQAQLEATPGYQFDLSQGLQGVANSNAAQGLGVSGAALKGAANYATGLADSTYQNQFNNALTNQTNQFSRLMSLTGLGEKASSELGSAGLDVGTNISANTIGAGDATAGSLVGAGNSIGGAYGNYMGANYLSSLMRNPVTPSAGSSGYTGNSGGFMGGNYNGSMGYGGMGNGINWATGGQS